MMQQELNSQFWKEFYSMLEKVKALEGSLTQLWKKWDWGQKMVIGILVALVLNLMGVIYLIAINGVK